MAHLICGLTFAQLVERKIAEQAAPSDKLLELVVLKFVFVQMIVYCWVTVSHWPCFLQTATNYM